MGPTELQQLIQHVTQTYGFSYAAAIMAAIDLVEIDGELTEEYGTRAVDSLQNLKHSLKQLNNDV